MLANAQLQGADMLGRVLGAAAARARTALGEPVVLSRCDDIEIREELSGLSFETWCLRKDHNGLTVKVLATARDQDGRECIVAAGRFTFSTFVTPSASMAARLRALDSRTQ